MLATILAISRPLSAKLLGWWRLCAYPEYREWADTQNRCAAIKQLRRNFACGRANGCECSLGLNEELRRSTAHGSLTT